MAGCGHASPGVSPNFQAATAATGGEKPGEEMPVRIKTLERRDDGMAAAFQPGSRQKALTGLVMLHSFNSQILADCLRRPRCDCVGQTQETGGALKGCLPLPWDCRC